MGVRSALESHGTDDLTPAQKGEDPADEALLDAIAGRVVKMSLAVPAVFFLESSKPLSFLGSQALVFLEPFVKAVLDLKSYDRFTALMEDRKNVERLIQKIESMEEARAREEREAKAAAKAARRAAHPQGARQGESGGWLSRWLRRKS